MALNIIFLFFSHSSFAINLLFFICKYNKCALRCNTRTTANSGKTVLQYSITSVCLRYVVCLDDECRDQDTPRVPVVLGPTYTKEIVIRVILLHRFYRRSLEPKVKREHWVRYKICTQLVLFFHNNNIDSLHCPWHALESRFVDLRKRLITHPCYDSNFRFRVVAKI